MPEAEKLPFIHPAEVHIDGIPQFSGDISASLQQGLVMTDARPMRGKQTGESLKVFPGDKGDLVFRALVDNDGAHLSVPVTVIGTENNQVALEFRNQLSAATAEVLRQIAPEVEAASDATALDSATVLAEFRKNSLGKIDNLINSFLMTLIDHLFDLSSQPHSKGQQEELYETMNIIKLGRDSMRKAFAVPLESIFDNPAKPVLEESSQDKQQSKLADLGLVDLNDFEDSLSLNRMTQMGQDKYNTALECLTLRFAELVVRTRLT